MDRPGSRGSACTPASRRPGSLARGTSTHDLPYGLRGSPLEHADLRPLLTAPLTLLLGTQDLTSPTTDPLVRGTPAAMMQGTTRLARGLNYYETGKASAQGLGAKFGWRLALAPGAGHEVTQVIASAGFLLFSPDERPCRSSSAAEAGRLVINEVLADPPRGSQGDANDDGIRDATADEFVEIVNAGPTPVCLAGWTLGDANERPNHLFPLGRALGRGKAVVIFGGGVPTGPFGDADVQWANSSGGLSLSNNGDVLSLRDADGAMAKQISWGDCAGKPCAADHRRGDLGFAGSLVRWPELVGAWRIHREVARSDFSPGLRADGSTW